VKPVKQRHIQTRSIEPAARTKNGIPKREILFQLARIFVACFSETLIGVIKDGDMEGLNALIWKNQKTISRLYPIVDADVLAKRELSMKAVAQALRAADVRMVQLRNKTGGPQKVLADAAVLQEVLGGSGCRLIMNDRADLAVLAGWDGVHVGQGDLSPADAKAVVLRTMPTYRMKQGRDEWGTRIVPGSEFWVGVSTHTEEQVRVADVGCADYVAVGPVFATGTKLDAEAVIGLEGVRRARALTKKPIVAIGGITRENARSVVEAGADSVAIISALFVEGETVEKVARDFLQNLR
jgi:thiamine-phosphate pyrophosphorylase